MTPALVYLGLLSLAPGPAASPAAAPARRAAASFSVGGQLRSAGLRAPIAGARVFATPRRGHAWTREVTTASDGSFVLTDLPTRDFVLTVVAAGHERLEQPTSAAYWTTRRPPVLYLQSSGAGHYRTIVAESRDPPPSPTRARLSPEEVATLPGSQGDPLRALQNLPGMARVPGGLGLLVMRGATPNQSQVFLGEHPIPRAFHFPGLASVVPGSALAGIEYTPGNFATNYGNAVGGIVTLTPRAGRRDGIHGMAKFDVTAAGALIEGPLRKGSFLIAAQRGYLDLVLQALAPLGLDALLPRYYDYQIVFEHPIGRGASVTTRFIGASDRVRLSRYETGELNSVFHRLDLSLRKRVGGWDFLLAPALRFDRGSITLGKDLVRPLLRRNDIVGLLRAEITARPSRRFTLTVGADTQLDRYNVLLNAAGSPGEAFSPQTGLATNNGLYVTPLLALGRFSLSPGVRVSAFTGANSRAFSVDPRLIVRWVPHRRVALSAGAGQYSQPSRPTSGFDLLQLTQGGDISTFAAGPDGSVAVLPGAVRYLDAALSLAPYGAIGVAQAAHVSGSIHVEIVESLGVTATGFYRRVRDGLSPRGPAAPREDTGSLAYGIEVLLRKDLTRRLYGWIAYTWMRAEQGTMDGERLTRRLAADFDQRHNLVVVLSVKLPHRWEIGGRFRVVSGLPFTPILGGIADANTVDPNGNIPSGPLFGTTNSARMATFHQLDLRIDRTWVLRRSIVSAYLDVQNVYNRQNPEGLIYNPHFTGSTTAVGIPVLPVFGVRVEY